MRPGNTPSTYRVGLHTLPPDLHACRLGGHGGRHWDRKILLRAWHGSATGAGGTPPGDFAAASVMRWLCRDEVCACGQEERGGQVQRLSLGVAEHEVLTVLVEQFQYLLAEGLIV